jgi:mono/diheme cytochrome c family protein
MSPGIRNLLFGLAASAFVAAAGLPIVAQDATGDAAATPTPEQVLAGKRVWTDAACFNCHGTNGQGGRSKDFPPGPSLRTSELDTDFMLEVIACGIPGTRMPGWAKGAYTERPCFGETGPVPDGTQVIGVYDEQQLADLMAFIETTFRNGAQ